MQNVADIDQRPVIRGNGVVDLVRGESRIRHCTSGERPVGGALPPADPYVPITPFAGLPRRGRRSSTRSSRRTRSSSPKTRPERGASPRAHQPA